jgi:uncharacterized protein (DUF2384 family)
MAVLETDEREALATVDEKLSHIQRSLDVAARSNALDLEIFERLNDTFKQVAGRLNANLPPEIDAATTDELRRRIVDVLTREFEGASPLDNADAFLIEMEAIRHIIRDVLDEQPPVALHDAAKAISLLEQWLPGVTQIQLSELIGISPRQMQRLVHAEQKSTPAPHRLQVVARIVAIIRHSWTPQGAVMWFQRPRAELGDRTPAALLDDPAHEHELIRAARAGRVQGAA